MDTLRQQSSWTKKFGSHTFYRRKNLQVKIKMIKELLLIIIGVAVADAAVCRIITCLTFQCGETNCPPGFRVKYRGGFCGCCDNCVEALSTILTNTYNIALETKNKYFYAYT
ncbi:uncharacterized protein TNIN_438611 [Trichonephila inaurata madagascariensis]|uniref:Uncharacterized protein n=1 Tax=Trichonephila inaurata madagascariensis TaxID=2747483 RepID=A0A8X6XCN8_9ARAC|nr:uncharacterized protein TNIN_438611 [Trichonephila inaurata madagascariensis]